MSQAKKVFTRMCLNNWGGIDHKVLEFHEYVNLFSGKSGSGKSTVMDAIHPSHFVWKFLTEFSE